MARLFRTPGPARRQLPGVGPRRLVAQIVQGGHGPRPRKDRDAGHGPRRAPRRRGRRRPDRGTGPRRRRRRRGPGPVARAGTVGCLEDAKTKAKAEAEASKRRELDAEATEVVRRGGRRSSRRAERAREAADDLVTRLARLQGAERGRFAGALESLRSGHPAKEASRGRARGDREGRSVAGLRDADPRSGQGPAPPTARGDGFPRASGRGGLG